MPNIRDKADATVILNDMRRDNLVGKADAHIKWIGTTGAKMDATIHAVAVACIYASMPVGEGGYLNGDVAVRLMNNMPKGSRAVTLKDWFEAFSNIRLRQEKTGKWSVKLVPPTHADYKEADPVSAFQKPFWSVDENTAGPKAFDLHALLAAVLKKANGKNVNLSEAELVAVKGITAIADGLVGKAAPSTETIKADPMEVVA